MKTIRNIMIISAIFTSFALLNQLVAGDDELVDSWLTVDQAEEGLTGNVAGDDGFRTEADFLQLIMSI